MTTAVLRGIAGIASLLLLAVGCSGDEPDQADGPDRAAAASMAAAITSPGGLLPESDQARCVASAFTDDLTDDQLRGTAAFDDDLQYVTNGAVADAEVATRYGDALIACLGQAETVAALISILKDGYNASTPDASTIYADCILPAYVERTDVDGVLVNRFITDQGEYAYQGRVFDAEDATALAESILGCADSVKADAQSAAESDPSIDAAELETCAKAAITTEFLRDEFLVNQLLGRTKKAEAAAATSSRVFQRCVEAQK